MIIHIIHDWNGIRIQLRTDSVEAVFWHMTMFPDAWRQNGCCLGNCEVLWIAVTLWSATSWIQDYPGTLGKQIISVLVPTTCSQTFSVLPLHVHLHTEQENVQNNRSYRLLLCSEDLLLETVDSSKESRYIAILSMFHPFDLYIVYTSMLVELQRFLRATMGCWSARHPQCEESLSLSLSRVNHMHMEWMTVCISLFLCVYVWTFHAWCKSPTHIDAISKPPVWQNNIDQRCMDLEEL